jgi:hypothetical protein
VSGLVLEDLNMRSTRSKAVPSSAPQAGLSPILIPSILTPPILTRTLAINLLLALTVLGVLSATPARAELVLVDGQVRVRDAGDTALPARGSSMRSVEERFGAPQSRSDAVGQPPITRWDYQGFSVFFEFDKVIHTVTRAS